MVAKQEEYLPTAVSPAVPAAFVHPLPVSVAAFPLATDAVPLVPHVISAGKVLSPPGAALLALFFPLHISHEALAPDTLMLPNVCEALVIGLHV